MGMIREEDKRYLKEEFEKILIDNVKLNLFLTEDEGCAHCRDAKQLLEEVAELSDKIELEMHSIHDEIAKDLGIFHAPSIVVVDSEGELDSRVRFTGLPSGYEFTALIKDIMYVSRRQLEISEKTIEELQKLNSNLKIEVYVTPTCPYCPKAVLLAHQFAMASERIAAEMIESLEFPALAERWGVMSVPHTVIRNLEKGNAVQLVGSYPEVYLLGFVKDADAGKEIDTR